MVKKAVDVKAKASLQPSFGTREIDSKCPKGYRPLVKKDKDVTNWKYQDEVSNKDKNKAKLYISSFANSLPQTQASKKNKHCESRWEGHSATKANITKVAKKDKVKDLSHIKYYTYK